MNAKNILVVDDVEDNREILKVRLEGEGFEVSLAENGQDALHRIEARRPDLILLDVMMPVMDGITAAKIIKERAGEHFVPIILLTAKTDVRFVVEGLNAGADDYLMKPVDQASLLARIRAMFRIQDLQNRLMTQTKLLADLNASLEQRVAAKVNELERVGRLSAFLPPQVVDIVTNEAGRGDLLASHRAEVSVVFSDLRGFTSFAETAEPEEILDVLGQFHRVVGEAAFDRGGTIERFAGDGVMVFFNDPVPYADHLMRAVTFGFDVLRSVARLSEDWRTRDIQLGVGVGVATGYATLGKIGFQKKWDYAAIGNVTNIASRLCSMARAGELRATQRVARATESIAVISEESRLEIKGLTRSVAAASLREK